MISVFHVISINISKKTCVSNKRNTISEHTCMYKVLLFCKLFNLMKLCKTKFTILFFLGIIFQMGINFMLNLKIIICLIC